MCFYAYVTSDHASEVRTDMTTKLAWVIVFTQPCVSLYSFNIKASTFVIITLPHLSQNISLVVFCFVWPYVSLTSTLHDNHCSLLLIFAGAGNATILRCQAKRYLSVVQDSGVQ